MRTLAVASGKGGSGKTTVTRTLAGLLARRRRVLMLDLDPQASLTAYCGLDPDATLADVIGDATAGRAQLRSVVVNVAERLDLAPAGGEMFGAEVGIASRMARELILRRALATVAADYDVALVDCGPGLGLLAINALAAADGLIVPAAPETLTLPALRRLLDVVEQIRAELNPGLAVLGVLLTKYNPRTLHHIEAEAAIRAAQVPMFRTTIGASIRVAEAAAARQTINEYEPTNARALEFEALAQEVNRWLNRNAPD